METLDTAFDVRCGERPRRAALFPHRVALAEDESAEERARVPEERACVG
jgi:hypothetical protein